jgi:hypothetical protein
VNEERPNDSAEAFDPVAFAEWWFEEEWPKKRPHEFACYMASLKRWEGKHEGD